MDNDTNPPAPGVYSPDQVCATRQPEQPAPLQEVEMSAEEIRLEDLKQMAAYAGPVVSFDVREPYYLASCDHCGWIGSSELCGTDSFGDDSDVYCPRCHSSGADLGKAAEAIERAKQAPTVAVPEDGVTEAIAFVRKRLDDYVAEHGMYDPSTGVTEFPGNGDEYVGELEEIIEGLEALRTEQRKAPTVAVSEVMALVPVKPTEAMKDAVRKNGGPQAVAWALAAWPDMLAAAPSSQ